MFHAILFTSKVLFSEGKFCEFLHQQVFTLDEVKKPVIFQIVGACPGLLTLWPGGEKLRISLWSSAPPNTKPVLATVFYCETVDEIVL